VVRLPEEGAEAEAPLKAAKRGGGRRKTAAGCRSLQRLLCTGGSVVEEPPFLGVPGMGIDLEVKVLPGLGREDRSEAQGAVREAGAERSVERTRGLTYRNRIGGAADQGEWAEIHEALVTKGSCVNPAAVRGRPMLLPGEISPCA
jgi:hypothetical protein